MNTAKRCSVINFYSYVQSNYVGDDIKDYFELPKIVQKLPKLELNLPKISICENLGLSFC